MNTSFDSSEGYSKENIVLLSKLTQARILQAEAELSYQRMQLLYFADPSEDLQDTLEAFTDEVLQPRKTAVYELMKEGAIGAIDIEGLKEMLPMMLYVLKSKVDIKLLLAVTGVHPALVENAMDALMELIKKDM